jgi:glycerol uptake facilitator protein
MDKKDVLPYIVCQIIGAYLGGAAVFATRYGLFNAVDPLRTKITSATILFPSYPNALFWPDYYPVDIGGTGALVAEVNTVFPAEMAILIEALIGGVGQLLIVSAVLDPDSPLHLPGIAPYIIGVYIVAGVSLIGPLTTAGITPIRDFGPRLFAWTLGYGHLAFPGVRGFEWTIYWVGPVLGAIVGVLIYDYLVKPYYKKLKAAKQVEVK